MRRIGPRATAGIAVALAAALGAACASESSSDDDTGSTAGTPPSIVPPRSDIAGTTTTTAAESGSGSPTPSTSLLPADDVDLPDAPPPSTIGPSTTRPGPLPVPAIALAPVGTFDAPVEIEYRPFDDRLFVVEQPGRIVAVGDLSTEVVLDLRGQVSTGGEQGLLGLSFHPDVDLAYVNYTDRDGDTVIAEYAIDAATAEFDVASARTVLTIDQPFANHNGGELEFGPDGYLYIGTGDGGSGGDPLRTALALDSRLGKLLRIDPLATADAPFTVPEGNPFVDVEGADPTIWSTGLRNPWRFSFDPATGDLWIADVGQNDLEEIDVARATAGRGAGRGLSFGWSAFEGNARFNGDQPEAGHVPPVVTYSHDTGGCSVSGGAVSRGDQLPGLDGWYVYGDYCTGQIWGYDTTGVGSPGVVELAELGGLAAIAAGPDGTLYAISNAGPVARIVAA